MNELTDGPISDDDFAAGWLLAWETFLSADGVPDLADVDLPPDLKRRLLRGTGCLHQLRNAWSDRCGPGAAPSGDAVPAHIGRFVIHRELGRGGFGIVYLARDPALGRDVAVKVPRPGVGHDPRAGERLALEAQTAAHLSHPNLVPVYEAGASDGVPYVVSAYCPGVSLADWLRQAPGPVPWRDAAHVVAAVARGVHHAHARGVLHRDLKPANVLLTLAEADPDSDGAAPASGLPLTSFVPRVADFGMAKFLAKAPGPDTASGVIQGTPAYMAPEQTAGRSRDITTAVDVYALGAILYEVLTGRPPFAADTPLATLDKVRTEPVAPPRAGRADLSADLETVCLKCLEKDPTKRYASAAELADDLDRLLRGEPVLARRTTTMEKLARAVRRHPAVAGLSAVLALALVGGLVATTALLREARWERDRAERHLGQLLGVSDETAITTVNSPELQTPELRPLRDRLLAESADRFVRLTADLSDGPTDRPLLARCHLRLGRLLFAMGKTAEARTASGRAVEAYERLARDRPDDPTARAGLALALMSLAYAEEDDRRREVVERACTAYEAAPWEGGKAPDAQEQVYATFLYDMGVAFARTDPDAARRYLTASCDRLRTLCAAGPPARRLALPALAHTLQFRCQLGRQGERHREAVEVGEEALAVATAACGEWPGDHNVWGELAGAYNEYGLALQAAGQPDLALAVWREGYDRLGDGGAVRSARGFPSVIARLTHVRLMIAYNLGQGAGRRGEVREGERWFRNAVELARPLQVVLPEDSLLLYMHGMSCENLIEYGGRPGRAADSLPLHQEGLASLEAALRLTPHDRGLRSDLGVCWHRYADALAGSGAPVRALAALGRAIAHQVLVVAATPEGPAGRDRLRSHLVRAVELIACRSAGPSQIPRSAD